MNVLREWLNAATEWEVDKLCLEAKTTKGTLQQHAGEYRHGKLEMSAELAGRLAEASHRMEREGLPALRRVDMSSTCRDCGYAQTCEIDSINSEEDLHG